MCATFYERNFQSEISEMNCEAFYSVYCVRIKGETGNEKACTIEQLLQKLCSTVDRIVRNVVKIKKFRNILIKF